MAKAYISEYARGTLSSRGMLPAGEEPAVATQVLDTTGTTVSAAFNAETTFIRVNVDGAVCYKFGTAPTAATTDSRLSGDSTEYFGVQKGSALKLSVIATT